LLHSYSLKVVQMIAPAAPVSMLWCYVIIVAVECLTDLCVSDVDKQLLCCFVAGVLLFLLAAVISRYVAAFITCHFSTLLLIQSLSI